MKKIYADAIFAAFSIIYLVVSMAFIILNGNSLLWLAGALSSLIVLEVLLYFTIFNSIKSSSQIGLFASMVFVVFLAAIAYFLSATAFFAAATGVITLIFGPFVLYDAYYRTLGEEPHKKFVEEISQPIAFKA